MQTFLMIVILLSLVVNMILLFAFQNMKLDDRKWYINIALFVFLFLLLNALAYSFEADHGGEIYLQMPSVPIGVWWCVVGVIDALLIWEGLRLKKMRTETIRQNSIKEAMNVLPIGICYFMDDGMLKLCNEQMGTNARIQIYKGGKWTTVKTVNYMYCPDAMKIKNLKPLTTYKFRTQAYANGTTGTPSDVVTVKTGSAVKPAVKSIKIVQKKKIKVNGWTSPGHWSGGYWYPPIYHKPYTWTKYKVKVTLKKKVPKIGGMWIGDTWTKGNKTSYTVWLPKGAQTGKKLNVYMNTGLSKSNGQGPQIKKVIKAK